MTETSFDPIVALPLSTRVWAFVHEGRIVSQNSAYRRRLLRSKDGSIISGRGLYLTDEGRDFKSAIQTKAYLAAPHGWQLAIGNMGVWIDYYFGSLRPDINNPTKLVLDSLEGIAYKNDRQVTVQIQRKFLDREHPRVVIRIWREEQNEPE